MAAFIDIPKTLWVAALLLIPALIIIWVRSKFSYWKNKGIPYLEPKFPWGNATNMLVDRKSIGHMFCDFYNKMKEQNLKYAGVYIFTAPIFVPIDPECIKQILIKDFQHFHARGFYNNGRDQPMSLNMLTVDGAKWKTLRSKFAPVFASGKIKYMYSLIVDCTNPLCEKISNSIKTRQPIDLKDIIGKFTTDTICSCAFGINCNSFTAPATMYKVAMDCMHRSQAFVRSIGIIFFPNLCRFLRMGLYVKEPLEYFASVIEESFNQRKTNLVYRTDFLQLTKDMQEKKNNEDFDVTFTEILAQSFLFFLGGYETSSAALSFLFLELAEHGEIQERLRQDILEVSKKHGGITYDALQKMKYLQCVIDETLRKHPSITIINRRCTEDYQLPNGEILEKGTDIIIPLLGIHKDPQYYPDPEVFNPDRFSEENKATRQPYTYLPFGEGPRNCVGSRFAFIEIKVAVSHMLSKFRFTLNKNMTTKRRYSAHFFLRLADDILLDAEEIK